MGLYSSVNREITMKRAILCLASLLLLEALAAGAGKALSKDEVIQLLTTGAEARVITLVRQYGIDFGVDEAAEREVRAAGGGDKLIAALREEAAKEAKKHLALGDTFLQASDLDGAAAQYGQALRFDSKNAGAHLGMGKVHEQRGDTAAALAEYQEAITAKPDSGAAYNAMGKLWEEKGERQKALAAYRSGLEAEPENAELKANYIRAAAKPAPPAPAKPAPPAVVAQAPAKEEVTAEPALQAGSTKANPKDGLTYVWIPPGTFQMGCSPGDSECESDEKPAHTVTITKGFWMGQTEVTQGAYQQVMHANPSHFHGEQLPVEDVSSDDANAYCRAVGMRLPTEAEWEYAARAGSTASRYGDTKEPNAWKLYDMLGKVSEWTNDRYDKNYYSQSPSQDPPGPSSGGQRAIRGGYGRVSSRVRLHFGNRGTRYLGFRCAGE
jgi:formylglycine-generating enzyme required for sulfatase activity